MRIPTRLNQVFCAPLVLLLSAGAAWAQVPQLLNYQGRIAVSGTNFTGTGQFKFALVDGRLMAYFVQRCLPQTRFRHHQPP